MRVIKMKQFSVEKKLNFDDMVMKLAVKPMTSTDLVKHLNSNNNVRGLISNMVRDGRLEIIKCPHCDIGKMYRVKK